MRRLVKPEKISHNGAVNKRRGVETPPFIILNPQFEARNPKWVKL
jgi:hypothetical protein